MKRFRMSVKMVGGIMIGKFVFIRKWYLQFRLNKYNFEKSVARLLERALIGNGFQKLDHLSEEAGALICVRQTAVEALFILWRSVERWHPIRLELISTPKKLMDQRVAVNGLHFYIILSRFHGAFFNTPTVISAIYLRNPI